MGCSFLQCSGDLDARSTIADCGDTLACRVEVGVPVRRMAKMSLELLNTGIVWKLPLVKMAVCCDDEVKIEVVDRRCSEV